MASFNTAKHYVQYREILHHLTPQNIHVTLHSSVSEMVQILYPNQLRYKKHRVLHGCFTESDSFHRHNYYELAICTSHVNDPK